MIMMMMIPAVNNIVFWFGAEAVQNPLPIGHEELSAQSELNLPGYELYNNTYQDWSPLSYKSYL